MKKIVSIVLPIFNEEKNIPLILDRIRTIFTEKVDKYDYEVICVDDGSKDNSFTILEEISKKDKHIKVLNFSRNFGHQLAITAGYDYSAGDAVICMDADLQQPPELVPQMIEKWEEGYDIVYTIRHSSVKQSILKTAIPSFFYTLINLISKTKINKNAADFRLISRNALNEFLQMREANRFIRGMVGWIGYRTTTIDYEVQKRIHGQSSYSISRLITFAIDAITSFSGTPLRFAFMLGLIIASLSFVTIIYYIIQYVFFDARYISGWLSVWISILFLGGIQLIFIGIVGEYIFKIYIEVKGRPLYIVNKKLNIEKKYYD
jgi:dolichol-phosphate mannosyltransferase